MRVFVVERYLPALTAEGVRAHAQQEEDALAAVVGVEDEVRHLRTTYLLDEELCFSLFDARSLDAVRQANALAGMPYERITEAFDVPDTSNGGH